MGRWKHVPSVRKRIRRWVVRLLAVAVTALGAYLVIAPLAVLGWQVVHYYNTVIWVPVSLVSAPPFDWVPSFEVHGHDAWRFPSLYRLLSHAPYWCLSGVGLILLGLLREIARLIRRPGAPIVLQRSA